MKNRKFLLMGIIMFCLVAIVTTTFATFVVGNYNLNDSVDNNRFTVSEVHEDGVNVTAQLVDSTLYFDALPTDIDGDVVYSKGTSESAPDYTAIIEVKITGETWTSVEISVVMDKSTPDTDNLVKLPEAITVNKSDAGEAVEGVYTISKDLVFGWGSKFGTGADANPSVWLDEEAQEGTYDTPESKIAALEGWKSTVEGYKYVVNVEVKQDNA